ncbi:MAG: TonB-dependent receptor [Planctomycetes bacterium]|nr:TonB-dependent receptor [Planctomycetota bacterium]
MSTSRRCPGLLAASLSVFVVPLMAQTPVPPPSVPPPQDPTKETPPVVVTASRAAQDPFAAPYAVSVLGSERIRQQGYRTMPQVLREQTSVLVQETSPGQGSPFIRGFTGFSNLLLIDGVRLNNSVFRSGPNQYWNTIDPLSLDRIELLKGPASALYGSDAIGGTVQAITRSPYVWKERGAAAGGSTYVRYATGEDAVWGRGEISVGQTHEDGTRTGFLIGGDAKSFGDLEGGRATGTQYETGYDETAFDVKVEHMLGKDARLVFLHQQVQQNNVPRSHATIFGEAYAGSAVGTDLRRDLDQNRRLTYLQYHRERLDGAVSGVHLNLSWHEQEESEDRIPANGRQTFQGFDVGTLGAWLQAESDAGSAGRLTYGIEYYRDDVYSFFRRATNAQAADPIQGPVANDATYDLLGIYVQDVIALGERAELTIGGRYTYAAADADSVRDPNTSTKIGLDDSWDQFTGNARLRYDLDPSHWNVYAGVSQGFRAPNLSDLSSFDTARSGEAEVPAPGLDPEHYVSYEIGTKVRGESVQGQAAWYYTDIDDQILRFPTGTTNANNQPIVTKDNVGDGYIQGIELEGSIRVIEATSVFGACTWQYGRVSNFNAGGTARTEEFVSRLMPVTTMVGLRWESAAGDLFAETFVVRAEDADKTAAGDNRDTQRIPPGGTPGYTLWNVRAGWQVSDTATVDVALDNLTDVDYRVHGSGSNGIGRSLIVGMSVRF